MMQSLSTAALLVGIAIAMPSLASANLLQNGDFATGPQIGPNGFTTVFRGQKSLAPWAVTTKSVDYIPSSFWQSPPNALASLDMNGSNKPNSNKMNQPGTLVQKFTTTPGASYTVSFYLSGNPSTGCGPVNKVLLAEASSVTKRFSWNIETMGNTFANMEWTSKQFAFTAADSVTTLQFISKTKGSCGPAIGQVSVDPNN